MPFANITRPSIQLGLLKSLLAANGFDSDTYYFNLDFSNLIGHRLYEEVYSCYDSLLGDWLFSEIAFNQNRRFNSIYLNKIHNIVNHRSKPNDVSTKRVISQLLSVKEKVTNRWLKRIFRRVDWSKYLATCFTCTYNQTLPSLVLARKIKKNTPNVITIFGGQSLDSCTGEEFFRHNNEIMDYLIQGDADKTFVNLVKNLSINKKPTTRIIKSDLFYDLDKLPIPNYDEYFHHIEKLKDNIIPDLPIETSRGCWWGEKNQCKFCGFNKETIKYREKSTSKIINELDALSSKYFRYNFAPTDSILSKKIFKNLLTKLAEQNTSFRFFFMN